MVGPWAYGGFEGRHVDRWLLSRAGWRADMLRGRTHIIHIIYYIYISCISCILYILYILYIEADSRLFFSFYVLISDVPPGHSLCLRIYLPTPF